MDNKIGTHTKQYMIIGFVHNATGIWYLWDIESRYIIECSVFKFDEDSTA